MVYFDLLTVLLHRDFGTVVQNPKQEEQSRGHTNRGGAVVGVTLHLTALAQWPHSSTAIVLESTIHGCNQFVLEEGFALRSSALQQGRLSVNTFEVPHKIVYEDDCGGHVGTSAGDIGDGAYRQRSRKDKLPYCSACREESDAPSSSTRRDPLWELEIESSPNLSRFLDTTETLEAEFIIEEANCIHQRRVLRSNKKTVSISKVASTMGT